MRIPARFAAVVAPFVRRIVARVTVSAPVAVK